MEYQKYVAERQEIQGQWWWVICELKDGAYIEIRRGKATSEAEAIAVGQQHLSLQMLRENVIKPFVLEIINDTTFRMGNNFMVYLDGQQLAQINQAFKNPLGCPLGQTLDEIARASLGLILDDEDGENRGVVCEGIQGLMEQLFAPPGLTYHYTIPSEFWNETPFGRMVRDAFFWCRGDELITQTQAAEILGKSVQSVNNYISAGKLMGYKVDKDSKAGRPGGVMVSRHEVQRMV